MVREGVDVGEVEREGVGGDGEVVELGLEVWVEYVF